MSSDRPLRWLSRIERILTARTHDLRALAKLADLDPATMYIGTRLDGADLRGQDLRGMTFTHLDPAKVQTDAGTRFDGQPEPAPSGAWLPPLVLFHDAALEEGYRRQPSRIPVEIKPFGAKDAEAFWRACEHYPGPKLVLGLASLGPPLRPYRPGGSEPTDVVRVLGVEARGLQFIRGVEAVIEELTPPTILVPLPMDFGRSGVTALSASFCDLVALAAMEWAIVADIAQTSQVSLFFTARPETADDPESAWFQLSARIRKLGLLDSARYRIGPQDDGAADVISDVLFRSAKPLAIRRIGRWPGARAMVFLHPTQARLWMSDGEYLDVVIRLLDAKGWSIIRAGDDRAGSKSAMIPSDLRVSGSQFEVDVDVSYRKRTDRLLSREALMPINAADSLCVSEDAEANAILWMLNKEHKLLVNLQDLRWLDPDAKSLWPVVAHQARRIARGSHSRSRTLYFVALMRSAIEAGNAANLDEGLAVRILSEEYGFREQLRVVTVEFESGRVVFRLRAQRGVRREIELVDLYLGVDADGPFIERIADTDF